MSYPINLYSPRSGRIIKDDGTVVNQANGINPDGSMNVSVVSGTINATLGDQQAKTIDVTLQDAATTAGNGTPFTVGAYKTLTIEINGTSTSRTVVFEGASTSGTYYPIQGVKLSDLSMATQTTGNGEVWTFEVTGLNTFRARISAVGGGSVTIKGKAVA